MERAVQPEWLDELAPEDPAAVHSRRDLRRVNAWMGHARMQAAFLARHYRGRPAPRKVLELGGGDATFLLGVAGWLSARWPKVEVCLVDRLDLVTAKTKEGYATLGWTLETRQEDVLAEGWDPGPADLVVANLFLHHFKAVQLRGLLAKVSAGADVVVATEPRRGWWGLLGTCGLGLIGCNHVTRHDAAISVRAGFRGRELSEVWASSGDWHTVETLAWPFTHFFAAWRKDVA